MHDESPVSPVSDEQFEAMIAKALDDLPEKYVSRLLKDVAVTWDEVPSEQQRQQLQLRNNQSLFGLYEGVPLPRRGGVTRLMPDKITLFRRPLMAFSHDVPSLQEQIKHTLWHEMAHYFGLDHDKIHELE